jgi:hypothetical protein
MAALCMKLLPSKERKTHQHARLRSPVNTPSLYHTLCGWCFSSGSSKTLIGQLQYQHRLSKACGRAPDGAVQAGDVRSRGASAADLVDLLEIFRDEVEILKVGLQDDVQLALDR